MATKKARGPCCWRKNSESICKHICVTFAFEFLIISCFTTAHIINNNNNIIETITNVMRVDKKNICH